MIHLLAGAFDAAWRRSSTRTAPRPDFAGFRPLFVGLPRAQVLDSATQGHNDSQPQQVVMLLLPASNGFAPNVNVQIQPFSGTIDAYMKVSHDEFKAMGISVLNEKRTGKDSVSFEYSGPMNGRTLHWYARAVRVPQKVYLVTATAAEEQWAASASDLKECVNSFTLTP